MSADDTETTETDHLRLIIRDEFNKCLLTHLKLCPFASQDVEGRLRKVEIGYARLIGFMVGSGFLGGTTGAAIAKWLT